jgi:hypothetical protein
MNLLESYMSPKRYRPRPETVEARRKLDHILRHTKFNHRTKALWAYYRGNKKSLGRFEQIVENVWREHGTGNRKARTLILLNLSLNGALEDALVGAHCCGCRLRYSYMGCKNRPSREDNMSRLIRSFRPETIANWEHAIKLINIAKEKNDSQDA